MYIHVYYILYFRIFTFNIMKIIILYRPFYVD